MPLQVPWIKRIDRGDHTARALALDAATSLPTTHHRAPGRERYEDRFECVDGLWFHVTHRWLGDQLADDDDREEPEPASQVIIERVWATHGTVARSDDALFVFMEHKEARHPVLEAALANDPAALGVYADWLEEQGDPYSASLKPALLKARGLAGLWFLEGLDRTGRIEFTLREGLVRGARLGAVPAPELLDALRQLCHLRASVALEQVSLAPPRNTPRWAPALTAPDAATVSQLPWPGSLKRLTLSRGQMTEWGDALRALRPGLQVTTD